MNSALPRLISSLALRPMLLLYPAPRRRRGVNTMGPAATPRARGLVEVSAKADELGRSMAVLSAVAAKPINARLDTVRWTIERRNRSEEHTSELQSRGHLVCRLLLE